MADIERYEHDSEGTTGMALDNARRHSIDEIANGMGIPPSYLESVMQRNEPVGAVLLAKFCRDEGVTPKYVRKFE